MYQEGLRIRVGAAVGVILHAYMHFRAILIERININLNAGTKRRD